MSITSYAQNFEDVMLWRALSGVPDGFYIDVGAQHPRIDSVSQAFREQGWSGIHIEPMAEYAALLRAERPGDTVIEAAVSNRRGLATFHRIPGTGLSTLDAQAAETGQAGGFEVEDSAIPTITLDDVFAGIERDIHWLKIDVEGHERCVLEGWQSAARPWILVIESTLPGSTQEVYQNWEPLVLDKGYRFVWFDGLNRFYVSDAHAELAASFSKPPNVFDTFRLSGEATSTFASRLKERAVEAAEHLATVEAAAEARIRGLEADGLAQQAGHERALADLRTQFEQDRHALAADHAEKLKEADRENRRLMETLVQASSEHAATLVRLHADQARQDQLARAALDTALDEAQRRFAQAVRAARDEREGLGEVLADVRGQLDEAQAALHAARLTGQAAAAAAAAKTAQLGEVRAQARKASEALSRQLQNDRADHARLREADAGERQRLLAQQLAIEARLTDAQAALQAALLAEQAARGRADAALDTGRRELERQQRLHRAWAHQLAAVRSALCGEIDAAGLIGRGVGADSSLESAASEDRAMAAATEREIDRELGALVETVVAMARFSDRLAATFHGRLRARLLTGRGRLTNKYPLATALMTHSAAARSVRSLAGDPSQAASDTGGGGLARETRTFRWFGFGRGRDQAIEGVEAAIGALRERMDQLTDIGSILIAQGTRHEEAALGDRVGGIEATLSGMTANVDRLTEFGIVSVAQGARLEEAMESGRGAADPAVAAAHELGADERPALLLAALEGRSDDRRLSPAGLATLGTLTRVLRARTH